MVAIGGGFLTTFAVPSFHDAHAGQPDLVKRYFAICSLFCGLASAWSKSAFAITLLRLTANGICRYFLWFVLITVNGAYIVFVISPWTHWNQHATLTLITWTVGTSGPWFACPPRHFFTNQYFISILGVYGFRAHHRPLDNPQKKYTEEQGKAGGRHRDEFWGTVRNSMMGIQYHVTPPHPPQVSNSGDRAGAIAIKRVMNMKGLDSKASHETYCKPKLPPTPALPMNVFLWKKKTLAHDNIRWKDYTMRL